MKQYDPNQCTVNGQFAYTVYPCIDSAHALFVRATYLVCHRPVSYTHLDVYKRQHVLSLVLMTAVL